MKKELKKELLRKVLIVTLAAFPAAVTSGISASASEAAVQEDPLYAQGEEKEQRTEETTETVLSPEHEQALAQEEEKEQPADEIEETEDTEESALSPENGQPLSEEEEVKEPSTEEAGESEETALSPENEQPLSEEEEEKEPSTEEAGESEETTLSPENEQPLSEEEEQTAEETVSAKEGETAKTAAYGAETVTSSEAKTEQKADRIHYITLKDANAASDSILIESNGHYGLIDASHPSSDPDSRISGYTVDVDNVIDYLKLAGVMHLDFVLGTHSHSDHIGGMKFLASALNSDGDYWVDSDTVYFFKQQYYNETEEGEWGWQNSRMFRQSYDAMEKRGAIMVETSTHDASLLEKAKATFVKGVNGLVSDSIEFLLGDFAVSLYNLYHNSSENENLNSIVTTVTKGDNTTLLMADLEMEGGYERAIAETVAEKYGNADVIKVGHHGYEECTSSDTLRTLDPSYIVTTSNRTGNYYSDEPPYNYYLAYHGITAYRAAEAVKALVEDVSGDEISFTTYDKNNRLTQKPVEWKGKMTSGWKKWNRDDGTYDYIYVYGDGSVATGISRLTMDGKTSTYLFGQDGVSLRGFQTVGNKTYYLNVKGEVQTGWKMVRNKWYYMDGSGVMKTGWLYNSGNWYYMGKNGAMQTSWQLVDGKWYYMNGSGVMKTGWLYSGGKWYLLEKSGAMKTGWVYSGGKWYYMDKSGAMQTGWVQIDGKWYYMNSSGAMKTGWLYSGGKWYFLEKSGAMKTGWVYSGGKWYYMDSSGAIMTGWIYDGRDWYYLNQSGAWQNV